MYTLCRHAAVKLVKGTQKTITVHDRRLTDYLGRKARRHENLLEEKQPGIVTGLAWTQAGGEILFIETSLIPGKGNLYLTGQLGDVMKESAEIALSLVKSIYPEETKQLEEKDIHIHVPAGAVPKDGPSAGITLVSALSSLVTGKSVSPKIAMTGEISLRGRVMPIGGLPEKLMAAQRAGIETVLIPSENVEDLEDVAEEVTDNLRIIPVTQIFEVLDLVLQ
jgi:ATP-dependent Lon protease